MAVNVEIPVTAKVPPIVAAFVTANPVPVALLSINAPAILAVLLDSK